MVQVASAWCLLKGACRSDMRNVLRKKHLNSVWHYTRGRGKKYDSRVEKWSMPSNFPAASAWQMTLLSLSCLASTGCLNSEDNRLTVCDITSLTALNPLWQNYGNSIHNKSSRHGGCLGDTIQLCSQSMSVQSLQRSPMYEDPSIN